MKKYSALILCSLITLSGCGQQETEKVQVCEYQKQQINDVFYQDGTISPADKPLNIETQLVGSRVKEVFVSTGDSVKAGDVICLLDTSDISEQIEELENAAKSAEESQNSAVAQAEKNLEFAKTSMDNETRKIQSQIDSAIRSRDSISEQIDSLKGKRDDASAQADSLYDQISGASDPEEIAALTAEYNAQLAMSEQYDQQISQYEQNLASADSQIENLEIELEMKQSQCSHNIETAEADLNEKKKQQPDSTRKKLEQLKEKLEQAEVKSPADGIITAVNVSAGQYCESGVVAGVRTEKLAVDLSIPDKYILLVNVGDKVSFKTGALNEKEYTGEVTEVSEIKENDGYSVSVSFDADEDILCGMTANVTFTAETLDCFSVPDSAVINSIDGVTSVYVAESNGDGSYYVDEKNIETGISNGVYTQILKADISEGELIITDPQDCHPGMKVELEEGTK